MRGRSLPAAVRLSLVAAALGLLLAGCGGDIGTPSEPLRILAPRLPDAILAESYNETVVATGGLRPYTFTLENGLLPPGIELQGGTLRGTPSELGNYSFTIAVSDANLASTFETFTLVVIEVPPPSLTLTPPPTEVQSVTTLRGRVEGARRLRALRTVIDFDPERFTLAPDSVVASRAGMALFHTSEPGLLRVDIAFLGAPFDGAGELFRFDLVPTEPTTVALRSETEFLFADRHHFARLEEGFAEPLAPDETDPTDESPEPDPDPDPNPDPNAIRGADR